jgi:hypothetical protein
LLPDVKTDDGRVQRALELSGPDVSTTVLYVDPDTSLVNRESYVLARGDRPVVEETFSDYRTVDGVKVAFDAERRVGPVVLKRRVKEIRINSSVAPGLFDPPRP